MNYQPRKAAYRVLSRIAAKSGPQALMLMLYAALFGEVALAAGSMHHELPMRAIVNGHNVQPRGDRLKALGFSELTSQQAEEVDRLYLLLMKNNLAANGSSS
jgi:hypothetical protein